MGAGRGKRIAISTAAAGLAVIAAAGWSLREVAVEEWQIRRLGSEDAGVRLDAAGRLTAMKSARAIPELLDLHDRQLVIREAVTDCVHACGPRAAASLEAWLAGDPQRRGTLHWAALLVDLRPESEIARRILLDAFAGKEGRDDAFYCLERAGVDTVPRLVEVLTGGDPMSCVWAADRLAWIGPAAAGAGPALEEASGDDDPLLAAQAATALAEIGAPPETVLPVLVRTITGGDPRNVPASAPESLAALGRDARGAMPVLVAALGSSRDSAARRVLAGIGPDAVGPLLAVIERGNPKRKMAALDVLARLKRKAVGSEGMLRALIEDPDPALAGSAARALIEIGGKPEAAAVVPVLVRVLGSPAPPPALVQALATVRTCGEAGLPAVRPIVDRCLEHPDRNVRLAAREAIGMLGPAAKEAIPQLERGLEDPDRRRNPVDPPVPVGAAFALLKMGPTARRSVPALEKVRASGPEVSRAWAAAALIAIEPERKDEILPEIAKMLEEVRFQDDAAKALRNLRGLARRAAPALVRVAMSADPDSEVAAQALDMIEPCDEDLRPIIEGIGSPDRRHQAIRSLVWISRAARLALPDLIAALRDREPGVRANAAKALGNLGPDAAAAAGALRDRLRDRDRDVRRAAGAALARVLGEE